MLLGAAKLLKEHEAELQGTVLLVFQPAEEGGAGADVMIQEGAIEGASAAFGMHVMPTLPTGQLALRPGTIMAGVSATLCHVYNHMAHGMTLRFTAIHSIRWCCGPILLDDTATRRAGSCCRSN